MTTQRPRQGRYANIKTVLPLCDVIAEAHRRWPDASIVGAVHDEEGKVRHCHVVIRFVGIVRWSGFADWLHERDGHEYAEAAGSWRRSVRYLLHLDNPEKARIPRDNLSAVGIDDSELSQLLGAAKLPILESLILAEQLPLHERFAFLVIERGHQPSEVSAALRCMMDLEHWHDSRTCRGLSRGNALPSMPPRSSAPLCGTATGAADGGVVDFDLDVDLDGDVDVSDPADLDLDEGGFPFPA